MLIPFIITGVLLGLSFAVSESYAHAPKDVSLSAITETTITINWTHASTAGQTPPCIAAISASTCLTDVDIMRLPGIFGSTAHSTLVGNNTAYVVYNNATGLTSYKDFSLAEGTAYTYEVCHGDGAADGADSCAAGDVGDTNAGTSARVTAATLASAITGLTVSADQNRVVLTWIGFVENGTDNGGGLVPLGAGSAGITLANDTAVAGYKVEYSSDGGTTYTTVTSNSSSTTRSYEVTGLQSSIEYIFRVAAVTDTDSATGAAGTTSIWSGITRGQPDITVSPAPRTTSYSIGSITDDNLQVTVKENKGWDRTLNVALYTNITEDQTKDDSDTYIIWNYFDPVHVSDPHGYFNTVNVVTAQSGVRTMDVTYEITWNKPLAKSDVILETANFQSNVGTTIIKEAWKSFPVKQISYETPEETSVETIMTLFDGGIMNHLLLNNNINHALLSDMQYFVSDEIIDVSQDEVVLQQEGETVQLFDKITLSQDNMKVGQKYLKTLVISGTLKDEFYQKGDSITFSISSPDGTESQITAVTTSARTFKVPIIIDEFESGSYQFQPIHSDLLGEPFFFKH